MPHLNPSPYSSSSLDELKRIRGVCFDIDDTFSSHGKILGEAYESLWRLKRAGFVLVPVTGRPAGWCDHISRFWPVNAVVGENGAFIDYLDDQKRKKTLIPPGGHPEGQKKLKALAGKIKTLFPHAEFASDQAFRVNDLAIDFCEDVEPWASEQVDELIELCRAEGAQAKLSSIHVNTWYGDFDKRKGLEHWFQMGMPGVHQPFPFRNEEWIYAGDSPNDEPMFEFFNNSVGVANIRPYLPRLKSLPRWITSAEAGLGFQEMTERLIAARSS
jgi:HAD superfamily hydrolase (TIGR01484 family)